MKLPKRPILYINKSLRESGISTTDTKLFPFLNSNLFNSQSKKKLSFNKIDAICNSSNIFNFISKREECKSFMFFGRSNVGKSTLVNKLMQAKVNEVSKQPGKTKELVFLRLNTTKLSYFIDAPGYGYASAASKDQIRKWGKLIQTYLKHTPNSQSQQIICLLDINHGIKNIDIMLFDMLQTYKRNFIITFTKCDKSSEQTLKQSQQLAMKLQQKYKFMNYYVHYTSCIKDQGVEELRNHILFKVIVSG